MWVVREHYQGEWVNTYFSGVVEAKKLCRKILKAGGASIVLRSAL